MARPSDAEIKETLGLEPHPTCGFVRESFRSESVVPGWDLDGFGGEVVTVGSLADGLLPQLFIPGGTWHVSRLRRGGEYALLATTEWPAVEREDVEVPDEAELMRSYPELADRIREFAHTKTPVHFGPEALPGNARSRALPVQQLE